MSSAIPNFPATGHFQQQSAARSTEPCSSNRLTLRSSRRQQRRFALSGNALGHICDELWSVPHYRLTAKIAVATGVELLIKTRLCLEHANGSLPALKRLQTQEVIELFSHLLAGRNADGRSTSQLLRQRNRRNERTFLLGVIRHVDDGAGSIWIFDPLVEAKTIASMPASGRAERGSVPARQIHLGELRREVTTRGAL